jgi:5,10-methylenetetrahydromethanopterin reductase
MRISVQSTRTNGSSIAQVLADVRQASERGLSGYWAPMFAGQDTLTVFALVGQAVPEIELGTAILPMPLRTPFALAQQARTVAEAIGDRLALGLGTSHEAAARDLFGSAWGPPVETARRYLAELRELLSGAGTRRIAGPPAPVPPLLLGAVNPAMLRLAAELADGVVTWSAGEVTFRELVAPAAASASGRFRVVASLPVSVTDDEAATRELIHRRLGANDRYPSYQRVLEREGAAGIAGLSLVGSAEAVRTRLAVFADLGVTEFAAHVTGLTSADVERTWDLLAKCAVT